MFIFLLLFWGEEHLGKLIPKPTGSIQPVEASVFDKY